MKRYVFSKKAIRLYRKYKKFQTGFLIHGADQLMHFDRTIFEDCFWWFVIVTAFCSAIFTASVLVKRHVDHPTVVSIEKDYTKWNTTFPAFTLCGKQKMNETALHNFLHEMRRRYSNRTQTEHFLRMLVHLTMNNLHTFFDLDEIKASEYLSIVDELTNRYEYNVVIDSPNRLKMERTITELGICDSFNSALTPYLTPEFFTKNQLPKKLPIFEINYLDANTFLMINDLESSDIYFHGPYDVPSSIPFIDIGTESTQYTGFEFSALVMLADSRVRGLFTSQRKCRFVDESNLQHFPWIYTFDLCKTQCKIEMMNDFCDCVPFFYKKREDETYCKSFSCIRSYDKIIKQICDRVECTRNCIDVKFNMKKLNQLAWFRGNSFRIDLDKPKLRVKREVIYQFTDVLIATGAAFALFVGVSVLSFTKITYLIAERIFKLLK